MSSAELTWLRPLDAEKAPMQDKRFAVTWNMLIKDNHLEFRDLLRRIYFKVLDNYIVTCRATPLADINRPLNRTWKSLLEQYELPLIDLGSAIRAAASSQTIPLIVTQIAGGKCMLLPGIVFTTIVSRESVNAQLLIAAGRTDFAAPKAPLPDGWLTDIPDSSSVMTGEIDGPLLNDKGYKVAYAPFESEPVVVPAVVPEIVTSDQPVDTP